MKTKYKYIILALLLSPSALLEAQNSNKGFLYIAPGTEVVSVSDFKNDSTAQFLNDGEFHLLQSMENNGTFNFTPSINSGTVFLDGDWQQTLSGTEIYNLNNLELDNYSDSTIKLMSNMRVEGMADFYSGILSVNQQANLTFTEDAEHDHSSEFSHIDGVSYKVGTNSFTYPCGDDTDYRPANISSPTFGSDEYRCEFISESSNDLFPHENKASTIRGIDNTGYWEIWRTNGNSNVIIGLSYDLINTSSEILNDLENVKVLRWDEFSEHWVSEGGVWLASEKMIFTVTQLDKYGRFTLGIEEPSADVITAYNLVSPNFNGQNDFLVLDGIQNFPNNEVTIVNRWGETVFEIEGYDNDERVFKGFANAGITSSENPLPDGTYFYVVNYVSSNGTTTRKVGFLELLNN